MHKGTAYPRDLTARVFMGDYTFPNWIGEAYVEGIPGPGYWLGPDAAQITNLQPYIIKRLPLLEDTPNHLVFAEEVEEITSGLVHTGLDIRIAPEKTFITISFQVWVAGARQLSHAGMEFRPGNWAFFAPNPPLIPLPGARLWHANTQWQALPY